MTAPDLVHLSRCGRFHHALQARPPRLVHATALASIALLGTALAWLASTEADLVVRAEGRVRAVAEPVGVFTASDSGADGRVVEVRFAEGDTVAAGDVLLRLDTARLQNEIETAKRAIAGAEEELARLAQLDELGAARLDAAAAKLAAETAAAREVLARARTRREAEVRVAELELETAEAELASLRTLAESGAAPRRKLEEAALHAARARGRLAEAALPPDDGAVQVLERSAALLQREHEIEREERALERTAKRALADAARRRLVDLELQRERAVLRAPASGIVTRGRIAVGDVLPPGCAVVEIVPQSGFAFEISVPTDEVAHVRTGMPAVVKLDAFDSQQYGTLAGVVRFIAPDSVVGGGQAAYTVKIDLASHRLARAGSRGEARLGMAGRAEIVTGSESLLVLLLRRIRRTVSLG